MQEKLSYITYMDPEFIMNQSDGGTNPFNYGDIIVVVDYIRFNRNTYYSSDMQWVKRNFPINIMVEVEKRSKYITDKFMVTGQRDTRVRFNLIRTYCAIRLATSREIFLYHLYGSTALISEEER